MNPIIDICIDTIKKNKQALVFCNSKRSVEKQAEDLAKNRKIQETVKNKKVLEEISFEFLNVLTNPTKQCKRDSFCIKQGIAFHHAGLTSQQRIIIENNFRLGNIKIICSTPTLAAGLDMPAFRTIIKDLKRFSGKWGMSYIPVLEYEQMAGRAGRPGMEEYGEAIAIAKNQNEKDAIIENYVYGKIEDLQSKLAVEPVLRCHILSLIATGFVTSKTQLIKFFSKTFHAQQFGDMDKLELLIKKVIKILKDYGFVEDSRNNFKGNSETKPESEQINYNSIKNNDFFSSASDLYESLTDSNEDDFELKITPLGSIVSNLYLDPYTANHLINSLDVAVEKMPELDGEKGVFSLLQLICYTIEMRPTLRLKVSEQPQIFNLVEEKKDFFFMKIPDDFDYDEFLRSVKTALFFNSWINEAEEETLLESYNIRPGEIRAKLNLMDWLMRCCIELTKAKGNFNLIKDLSKLQTRLKYGVREELLPLLKLKGIGRSRARKLFRENIRQLKDIKYLELSKLERILGKKTAENVLSQVNKKLDKQNTLISY